MTYAWPSASIHPARCQGTRRDGSQCTRKKWTEDRKLPYFCQHHHPEPFKLDGISSATWAAAGGLQRKVTYSFANGQSWSVWGEVDLAYYEAERAGLSAAQAILEVAARLRAQETLAAEAALQEREEG